MLGPMSSQLGPVEYIMINFPGNRFDGSIAPAIGDLVQRDLVRILDLVFVLKDADGEITSLEYDEIDVGAEFAAIEGEADGMLNEQDIEALAAELEPDSSALFILWEDRWAADLGRAVRSAGGELVGGGRIPYQVVDEIVGATSAVEEGVQS